MYAPFSVSFTVYSRYPAEITGFFIRPGSFLCRISGSVPYNREPPAGGLSSRRRRGKHSCRLFPRPGRIPLVFRGSFRSRFPSRCRDRIPKGPFRLYPACSVSPLHAEMRFHRRGVHRFIFTRFVFFNDVRYFPGNAGNDFNAGRFQCLEGIGADISR